MKTVINRMMANLDELTVGDRATVETIGGERGVRRRLLEMGLLPGTELRVVRRAPMGDPIELHLRGYSLSIRSEDAATIRVDRQVDATPVAAFVPAE